MTVDRYTVSTKGIPIPTDHSDEGDAKQITVYLTAKNRLSSVTVKEIELTGAAPVEAEAANGTVNIRYVPGTKLFYEWNKPVTKTSKELQEGEELKIKTDGPKIQVLHTKRTEEGKLDEHDAKAYFVPDLDLLDQSKRTTITTKDVFGNQTIQIECPRATIPTEKARRTEAAEMKRKSQVFDAPDDSDDAAGDFQGEESHNLDGGFDGFAASGSGTLTLKKKSSSRKKSSVQETTFEASAVPHRRGRSSRRQKSAEVTPAVAGEAGLASVVYSWNRAPKQEDDAKLCSCNAFTMCASAVHMYDETNGILLDCSKVGKQTIYYLATKPGFASLSYEESYDIVAASSPVLGQDKSNRMMVSATTMMKDDISDPDTNVWYSFACPLPSITDDFSGYMAWQAANSGNQFPFVDAENFDLGVTSDIVIPEAVCKTSRTVTMHTVSVKPGYAPTRSQFDVAIEPAFMPTDFKYMPSDGTRPAGVKVGDSGPAYNSKVRVFYSWKTSPPTTVDGTVRHSCTCSGYVLCSADVHECAFTNKFMLMDEDQAASATDEQARSGKRTLHIQTFQQNRAPTLSSTVIAVDSVKMPTFRFDATSGTIILGGRRSSTTKIFYSWIQPSGSAEEVDDADLNELIFVSSPENKEMILIPASVTNVPGVKTFFVKGVKESFQSNVASHTFKILPSIEDCDVFSAGCARCDNVRSLFCVCVFRKRMPLDPTSAIMTKSSYLGSNSMCLSTVNLLTVYMLYDVTITKGNRICSLCIHCGRFY
jgi:hypothetical protein